MWNLENRAAFRACVTDLLNNPEVQKMRENPAACAGCQLFAALPVCSIFKFFVLPEISFGCCFGGARRFAA